MKKLTGNEIIKMYIDYFKSLGHTEIESASLIPYNDNIIDKIDINYNYAIIRVLWSIVTQIYNTRRR